MNFDKKNVYIIGSRNTGKTSSLIYKAVDNKIKNIVMIEPNYGKLLAEQLGLDVENFNFMSYFDFKKNNDKWNEPFVVDEIDCFLKYMYEGYNGFSMTINDSMNG